MIQIDDRVEVLEYDVAAAVCRQWRVVAIQALQKVELVRFFASSTVWATHEGIRR